MIKAIITPIGMVHGRVSLNNLKFKLGKNNFTSGSLLSYDMSFWFYKDNVPGFFPMNILNNNDDKIIYIDPEKEYIRFMDSIDCTGFLKIPFNNFCSRNGTCSASCANLKVIITKSGITDTIAGNFMFDFRTSNEITLNEKK